MRKMEVDAEIDRLSGVYSGWKNQQYKIRSDIGYAKSREPVLRQRIGQLQEEIATRDANAGELELVKPGSILDVIKGKGQQVRAFAGDTARKDFNAAFAKIAGDVVRRKPKDPELVGHASGLPLRVEYHPISQNLYVQVGGFKRFDIWTGEEGVLDKTDYYRRAANALDGLEGEVAQRETDIASARRQVADLSKNVEDTWPYIDQLAKLVEEQQQLVKDLGANKGDDAAAAVGESGEIVDDRVQAEETPDEDDGGEDGDEEGPEPPEPTKKAKPPAKKPPAKAEVFRGNDPVRLAEALRPLSEAPKPRGSSGWGGNLATPSGDYLTDGASAIVAAEVKDPAVLDKLRDKGDFVRNVEDDPIRKKVEEAAGAARIPLQAVGYARVASLKEAKDETNVAYFMGPNRAIYPVDADRLQTVLKAVGGEGAEIYGQPDSGAAIVVKREGHPLAVVMPMLSTRIPMPAVDAVLKFLKDETGTSSVGRALHDLFSRKPAAPAPWIEDIKSRLNPETASQPPDTFSARGRESSIEDLPAGPPPPRVSGSAQRPVITPVADASGDREPQIRPSTLAAKVDQQAVASGLTEGFRGMPEYEVMNVAEQSRRAAELVERDLAGAINVAMGRAIPPEGVLPESVFVAVENYATEAKDVNLLRALATSSALSLEATGMGQRIRMLAERNPDSAVAAIQRLSDARKAASERKHGPKAEDRMKKEIKSEIQKQHKNPQTWNEFLEAIKCR